MTPEEKARREIDRQLEQCGWLVQDHARMNLSAGFAIAVRSFPLKTGFADYLLYVAGKAVGVIEAKPEGHTLTGVEIQSGKYTIGLAEQVPHYVLPLPFAYETTGAETRFTNGLDPVPCSRGVFRFHRPDELIRLAELGKAQLRDGLRHLPELNEAGLWRVQVEAIHNLEASLAAGRPRALIQMATGSGKTYTACSFCYRLITFAKARRILFLVDRNTLGKQALNEFQRYTSPYTNYAFTEEFPVQRLTRNTIDPAAKVCITTIQRLYSMLKGEEEYPEDNEEPSLFEAEPSPLVSESLPVVYNPRIPIEAFDVIVVDECHRSIYNLWRQVLEYFDAFIVGLTATPTPQTVGFFHGNVVQDYSHEKAVADQVNVRYDVYSIRTQVTASGATLTREPGLLVPHRDRRTRKRRLAELADDFTYSAGQLDRDVVNPSQLRLVIRTFRERLFTEIFPGRSEVPKTLVFAKTDLHADDIVKAIREEFGKGNEFCQKITCKTTGRKPEDILSEFRNSYFPRIAVTVDMIATGTDVKAIECLLFMRNVTSASYFEQMKGRGCRVIGSDDLQAVTPGAHSKTRFVIVDAVGVCENDKTTSKPLDRKPSVSTEKLLQMVAQGMVHADLASTLAARLASLQHELTPAQAAEIATCAGGTSLGTLTADLLASLDPDLNAAKAKALFSLPEYEEPTERQLDEAERQSLAAALKPFHDPTLREAIIAAKAMAEQIIDEVTQDSLLSAGHDAKARDRARSVLTDFRAFLEAHRDEIAAVKLLYSQPYRSGLRYSQVKDLARKLARPPFNVSPDRAPYAETLWKAFELAEPERVRAHGGKALVDLVALVRHALHPEAALLPVAIDIEQRYTAWLQEKEQAGGSFTPEQRRWLGVIKDHVATSLRIEPDDFEYAPFSQLGGLGKAHEVFGADLAGVLEELNRVLAA